MKNKNFYASVSHNVEGRGRLIQYPPSPFDPLDQLFVECKKHKKQIRVKSALNDIHDLSAIYKAFDECPNCLDEEAAKKSRWPEGAEL